LSDAVGVYEKRSIVRQGLTDLHLWDSSIASYAPIELFTNDKNIGAILKNIVCTSTTVSKGSSVS
jgi:hypothetical protein